MSIRSLQKYRLDIEIDYWWKLMQFSKESYNRIRKTACCGVELQVKNYEGKASGSLQHKTWNLGWLKPTMRYDETKTYGQLQNKVWDPGKRRIEDT